ncbi:hypothetical protein [Actinoplanes campanulatus]|uniref:hypothetical protein n=1 Tax=Actinoplanes campanulatus TaxID=113559 RepID=UPI001952E994|nr:hypothetical protein [Actinoplanes capillaceus]
MTLYLDVAEYVQRLESGFEAITDPYGDAPSGWSEQLVHPQRLSARVKLLAPRSVRDAWTAFERAETHLDWDLNENPDGFHGGGPYLKPDNAVVSAARQSVGELQRVLREAMSDVDIAD